VVGSADRGDLAGNAPFVADGSAAPPGVAPFLTGLGVNFTFHVSIASTLAIPLARMNDTDSSRSADGGGRLPLCGVDIESAFVSD
jgi:hypothetical protein